MSYLPHTSCAAGHTTQNPASQLRVRAREGRLSECWAEGTPLCGTLLSFFFLVFEGRPLTLDTKHQPNPYLVMREARESLTQMERQIRQPQMRDYHTELNSKASPDFQGPDWSNPDLPFSSLPRITEAQRLIFPHLGGSLEYLSPSILATPGSFLHHGPCSPSPSDLKSS